ncbi:MAG: tRNA epoxyqueuosine(34) reductase QueG [Candidatus Cloacimonetes bacterium]|nr:tRNA epoxyqueuosine(34) reductase QueG [Candidatus Cloacimonadota bacterium]
MSVTAEERAALVRKIALEEGAQLAGIADGRRPVSHAARWLEWLDAGHAGPMPWLEAHRTLKTDPGQLLPGLRGMLCIAISSNHRVSDLPDRPRVSQYARGRDYHRVLRGILKRVARRLEQELGPFSWRVCVDTAPLLERYWAWQAGLGWIGKNCLLINRRWGSWLLLGELLTDLELMPDTPGRESCGRCERCLQACPTQALPAPGVLDAARCLSAQTIENRAPELPAELHPLPENWIFGCDSCQLCCPWNRPGRDADGLPAGHPGLLPDPDLERIIARAQWPDERSSPEEWARFWEELTRGKALRRMTLPMLRRNLAALWGRSGENKSDPRGSPLWENNRSAEDRERGF